MSELASTMESERMLERSRAVRHLLSRPLTLASKDPDAFTAIARHRAWLVPWFAEHPGWKLTVDMPAGFARLYKIPAGDDSTRAAQAQGRGDFDCRRYTLFCLCLAACDESGPQTTLANLSRRITELSADEAGLVPFDSTSSYERRAFVEALRLLIDLGILAVREGDAERYAQARDCDALLDIEQRLLPHLLAAPVPPTFAGAPDRLLDEAWPDTDEGRRLRHRHHAIRRLLDDPVLYFEDLDPAAFEWLDHSRGWLYRLLENDTGLLLERRAEGLAAVDPSGVTADILFPDGGSTVKHAALLLAEQFVRLHKQGTAFLARVDAVALTQKLHRDFGERCAWSKQYPPDDDGCARLLDEAMRLLEAFGLVLRDPAGWRARPAIARFRPSIPTRAPART